MLRPRARDGKLIKMNADARFWDKVERSEGCWRWKGSRGRAGYGGFWNGERLVPAHRWSYERFVGPIPPGLHIDHLCKNPSCVNPTHLEPVTPRENLMRSDNPNARNASKTHCPAGHPLSGKNLWTEARGSRHCLYCNRLRLRRRRARARAISGELNSKEQQKNLGKNS